MKIHKSLNNNHQATILELFKKKLIQLKKLIKIHKNLINNHQATILELFKKKLIQS
jgi:hypothetical protein